MKTLPDMKSMDCRTACGSDRKTEDSIGIAFTYNEPLIEWEYILDVAKLVKPAGKKVVLVSNGCAEQWVLETLAPYIDAMNIDLKGDAVFYRELQGSYAQVKHTIEYMHDKCHLEITSLIRNRSGRKRESCAGHAGRRNGISAGIHPVASGHHACAGMRNGSRLVGHENRRGAGEYYG